jgi:hypothetical protein
MPTPKLPRSLEVKLVDSCEMTSVALAPKQLSFCRVLYSLLCLIMLHKFILDEFYGLRPCGLEAWSVSDVRMNNCMGGWGFSVFDRTPSVCLEITIISIIIVKTASHASNKTIAPAKRESFLFSFVCSSEHGRRSRGVPGPYPLSDNVGVHMSADPHFVDVYIKSVYVLIRTLESVASLGVP